MGLIEHAKKGASVRLFALMGGYSIGPGFSAAVLKLKLNPLVKQWLGAGLLLLISAMFALMVLVRQWELDAARKLADSGTHADATVTHMKCCAQRRIGKSRRSFITYRFQVGERQFGGKDREIPPDKYAGVQVGSKIPVLFNPANPNRHVTLLELAELEQWGYRIGFSLLSLVLLTLCILRLRNPSWK
jgi:Protein of unknown function (DUF3592)